MKNYSSTTFIILTLVTLVACEKYTDEFYGPALGIAPDYFSASGLTVSNDAPNFLSQKVYFESTFNATVRWKLTLTGGIRLTRCFLFAVSKLEKPLKISTNGLLANWLLLFQSLLVLILLAKLPHSNEVVRQFS